MSTLAHDLRFSLRQMAAKPGYTAVVVLVLALGIGANSAVFSLANELLLRPLTGDRVPGEIVGLYDRDREQPDNYRSFSYPNYLDIREETDVFTDVAAIGLGLVGLSEGDATRRAMGLVVSSNYFDTFGGGLTAGRPFTLDEERPGSDSRVVVVSHGFWRSRGGGSELLGSSLRINGRPFTVVGVTTPGFTGPIALVAPEVYFPLGSWELVVNDLFRRDPARGGLADRGHRALLLFGRLHPGLTEEDAAPRLAALSHHLEEAYPAANENQEIVVHRVQRLGLSTSPGDDGQAVGLLLLLQAMSGVVLLIACINLANLLLARANARRREIGIRLALGAGRGRIVRQLLVEGFVLALAGGAAGLLLAQGAMRLLVSSLSGAFPVVIEYNTRPDLRIVAATLGFAIAATLLFALWPALRLARTQLVPELKRQTADHGGSGRPRKLSLRNALVVAQIALSLGLLTAGGLFLRSATAAARAEPGFELKNGLIAGVDPQLAGYDEQRGREIYRTLLERVRALPGVEAASVASLVPYGSVTERETVRRPGLGDDTADAAAIHNVVGADYFAALGLPMLRGRGFTRGEEESPDAAPVALIDEPLAKRLFPDQDPLGQEIVFIADDDVTAKGPALTVVGIIPGLRHDLFDRTPVAHAYTPFGSGYRSWMNLHVRLAGGGPAAEAAAIDTLRRTLGGVDEALPIFSVESLESHRDGSVQLWMARTGARLFTVFGGLALFLAVVGVYGVRAYLVTLRTREIGIRVALGAGPRQVLWLVLRDGMALTAVGLAAGLGLAVLIAMAAGKFLYQASPFDPIAFSGALALLFAAAMIATLLPAQRALAVSPTEALRAE